ncbi:oxygen-dependent tRNA uridine(34) hydroxylase TrhO [Leptothrix discophora]|uniref:Rhodanese-like domain-containing protein n=1 Tax=Leptothrix discophora TaxID=89 RepID=A0ABT9G7C5_LEPDI|nr:rhodanese-like domain-containing protein [Leptothrix discophora]MDP4302383.1 rhodanese-like domain-containing protein [Leptothrix discophora]
MSRAAAPFVHSAFYRYVALADPAAMAESLRQLGARLGAPQALGGSLIVAAEGLNAVVAGTPAAVDAFEAALTRDAAFAPFHGLAFQRSACTAMPFGRYKVAHKAELVAIDLPADAGPVDERDDSHVAPADWDALIARPDVVLIDNRNHFEFRLGRFRGAVDPSVDHFRDFGAYVQAHAEAWRAAGTTVAMYCTGGIRCDRTAPWMRSLGLDVRQLQGGILGYLADRCANPPVDAKADEHAWIGDCYVFDRRVAIDATLAETGLTPEQVYDPARPDEAWRLARARRLDGAMSPSPPPSLPPGPPRNPPATSA